MEEPSECELQMSRQAKQKKKGNVRTEVFASHSSHSFTPEAEGGKAVHPSSLETARMLQLHLMQN